MIEILKKAQNVFKSKKEKTGNFEIIEPKDIEL
jgi:hypothetical protein